MGVIGNLVVKLTADVSRFEQSLERAEKSLRGTEKSFARTARRMESIGQSLVIGLTVPLMIISGVAAKAAIDWEDSFAGVRKTVDATEAQYAQLARGLRNMAANDIPQTANALAGIAENAGQLGIQRPAILGFTKTMAELGDTTNLAGEEAAKSLARFDNIMQSGQKSFDRMGSTIVALGNNLATTESEIMAMSMRLAGAGKAIQLTEAQVFGLAGGLSSVGIEAEAGGSAMSKIMVDLASAVAAGGSKLDMFAKVSGMSAAQFKTAWQQDAAGALVTFIEGLGNVQKAGGNVFGVIDALGMSEVRTRDALLRAAGAGDLFRRSIDLASQAWEENTALGKEAQKRYATLASQLKFTRNKAMDMAISFGEGLAPFMRTALEAVQPFVDKLRDLAEGFSKLDPWVRKLIVSLLITVALVGPTTMAFGALYRMLGSVSLAASTMSGFAARAAFAFNAWRGGAASVGEALTHLVGSKLALVTISVLGLAAVVVYVALNWERFAGIASRIWNGISAVVVYSVSLMVRGVGALLSAFALIIPGLRPAAQAVTGYANSLKDAAQSAWKMATAGQAAAGVQQVADSADKTAQAGDAAARSQEGLADAMSDAATAAGNNLQSFDEVHQIQEAAAGADLNIPGLDMPDNAGLSLPEIAVPGADMFDGLVEQISAMGERLSSTWTTVSQSMSAAWEGIKAGAYATFPGLEAAVNGVNVAVDWMRQNWPTIGPIVETITSVITTLFIPALIKTGVEATIAGAKAVASWVAQGIEAAASVAVQVAKFAIAGAKWVWLGVEAAAGAAKVVAAWVVQGFEATASVAAQVAQFVIAGAKWVWLGVVAVAEGAKVAAVWLAQKAEAIAAVAVQVVQFGIVVAQWVWMGVVALASAAEVALAWLIAMGPIALVIAAVVALVALIIIYWDEIKAWTIAAWTAVVDWLSQAWESIKATAMAVWEGIKAFFAKWWDVLLAVFLGPIGLLVALLVKHWDEIKAFTSRVWDSIKAFFAEWWDELLALITGPIGILAYLIYHNWDEIKAFTINTWNSIMSWLSGVWDSITSRATAAWTWLRDSVTGLVTGARDAVAGAWQWVADRLSSIWNSIKTTAASAWAAVVDVIKAPINSIIGAINRFLDALSSIKISVPKVNIPLVGEVGGFTIGMPSLPKIPMLATGGDIVGRGAAIVGEAGPELLDLPRGARVTPLSGASGMDADAIEQAVYRGMLTALQVAGLTGRGQSSDREAVLELDGQRFARIVLPALEREAERTGRRLVLREV